jgi:hypothetical protein
MLIDLLHSIAQAYRPPKASSPSLFDFIRLQALIYEESRRMHDLLFRHLIDAFRVTAAEGREGEIADVLCRAQLVLLKHPIAAQAAFAALIAEGRRFAKTPEGATWMAALSGSDVVRQLRPVWEAVSLDMLEDDPDTIVPSAYLEVLLKAAKSTDLDALLRKLHDPLNGGEHGAPRQHP